MSTIYTPAPRVDGVVRLPTAGDVRSAASVAGPLQTIADQVRYGRTLQVRSFRTNQIPGSPALRGIAAGLGPQLGGAGVPVVRPPVVVAVGAGAFASADGNTWGMVDAGAYNAAAFSEALGLWALVGPQSKTTPDLTTWTSRTMPQQAALRAIGVDDVGRFVAAGDVAGTQSFVVRSVDGATWAQQSVPVGVPLYGVAFGGGTWVMVGGTTDGPVAVVGQDGGDELLLAEAGVPPDAGGPLQAVVWDGQWFVAISRTGRVVRSADGTSWDLLPASDLMGLTAIGAGIAADPAAGVLLATANGYGRLVASFDHGATWEDAAWVGASFNQWAEITQLAWARDRFVGAARNGYVAQSLGR